jgi:hypothetical protein
LPEFRRNMAGTGRIPFLPIPRGGKIQIPETGMCNLAKDKMMVQYFTAPSFLYPNQESYGLTKDQSMGSFHVRNMETYTS